MNMNDIQARPIGNDYDAVRTSDVKSTNRFKYIRISNQERTSGTPSNFQVVLGNDPTLDRCTEFRLMTAIIPNVGLNVSAAIGNNFFRYQFPPNPVISHPIPDGFYNISQLLLLLNALPAPPLGSLIFSQSQTTGQIIATSTISPLIIFGSRTFPNTSGINSYLGYGQDTGPALTVESQTRPSLFGDTVFYIHSPELATNITYLDTLLTGGQTNDVNGMFTIPVTVPYNSIQSYIGQEEDRVIFGRRGKSVRNFTIVLRGNNGRELVLGENDQVIIVLKAIFSVDQY